MTVASPARRGAVRAEVGGRYRADARYPAAMVNVTNRCNLSCAHCFVFRDGNPNAAPRSVRDEMPDDVLLATLAALRDRHGIETMLWMGGEPLLRRGLLSAGVKLFRRNVVTTNGTVPLVDFGPGVLYVVSLDGPEDVNDALRGTGTYRRVLRTLGRLPALFATPVQVQCVVTRRNERRLEELVVALRATRVRWMTFSWYVPRRHDTSGNAWEDNAARAWSVHEVQRLKRRYPGFIRNGTRSLALMLPPACERITAACPAAQHVLPLWMEGDRLRTPFCCYGNDVDCARCGAWVVFSLAAKLAAASAHPEHGP